MDTYTVIIVDVDEKTNVQHMDKKTLTEKLNNKYFGECPTAFDISSVTGPLRPNSIYIAKNTETFFIKAVKTVKFTLESY